MIIFHHCSSLSKLSNNESPAAAVDVSAGCNLDNGLSSSLVAMMFFVCWVGYHTFHHHQRRRMTGVKCYARA